MDKQYCKPLTPAFRAELYHSIQRQIEELKTCNSNVLVKIEIEELNSLRWLISILPDGYPIPIRRDLTKQRGE